jgi:hypothetical protein
MNREGARVVLGTLALRDFRNLARLDLGFPSASAVVDMTREAQIAVILETIGAALDEGGGRRAEG